MTPIDHTADWRTKLTQATEGVSHEDYEALKRAAFDWPTCACGELDEWIERDPGGEPDDARLAALGGYFYGQVSVRNYARALTTLNAIEQRAMELKP